MIVALGTMVAPSLEAAKILEQEGFSCCVVNCRFVKPLDPKLADYTYQESDRCGGEHQTRGLSGAVLELQTMTS
jgi:transketolase C-terminal domain/subunit